MGKSLPSAVRFQDFARVVASDRLQHCPKQVKTGSKTRVESGKPERLSVKKMEGSSEGAARRQQTGEQRRVPLAAVVSDCVRRWFQDTLKEARAGDTAMQVLVGQMYCSGYGIPRDAQKGRAWLTKASKNRPSVWKVGDKCPGYNASDSDSDDVKNEAK